VEGEALITASRLALNLPSHPLSFIFGWVLHGSVAGWAGKKEVVTLL
jgi:hypothetical protein